MLAIAHGKLNPHVRKVMSGGNVTQTKELFHEVSVEKIAHCLGLRCDSVHGLSVAVLSALHTEQIPKKVCDL